jgi:hypothetical protein
VVQHFGPAPSMGDHRLRELTREAITGRCRSHTAQAAPEPGLQSPGVADSVAGLPDDARPPSIR